MTTYTKRRWLVPITTLAVGLLTGAALLVVAPHAAHGVGATTMQSTPITIDASAGEQFSSALAPQKAAMNASQAYAAWMTSIGSSDTTIPADYSVALGTLNLPRHASNQLAYGYVGQPTTCRYPGAASQPTDADGEPAQCVRWTFLDASSGALIDSTLQPVATN